MKETHLIPQGATSVDIETLHEFNIPAPDNKPPTIVSASASSPTLPDGKILLNAMATDPDGTVTKYQWFSIDGLIINNAAAASTFATATAPGSYRFQVTATDDDDATATSLIVIATVGSTADTTPPSVSAGNDISITLPTSSVQLNGSGSDTGGAITFLWSKKSGSGALVNATSAVAQVTGLTQGVSVFTLTATDKAGNKTSDDTTVTTNAANVPGTSFPFSFGQGTSDFARPFAGFEKWINQFDNALPSNLLLDEYDRFGWGQLETSKGVFNFKPIEDKIKACAARGGKFNFGIMTYLPGAAVGWKETVRWSDGSAGLYPQYIHDAMQASSFKDVKKDSTWCPNWNSPDYTGGHANLYKALYKWLNETKLNNIPYKEYINYIDIRGYGRWSEWHMYEDSAPAATEASLMAIAKGIADNIPDIWLVALSDAFAPFNNQDVTPNVAYYLLTGSNLKGEFGWRKDHFGSDNFNGESGKYEGISNVVNGKKLGDLVINKWKVAPIVGEPSQSSTYNNMVADVTRYHATSVGNGNYGSRTASNIVNANKVIGARVGTPSGTVTTNTGAIGVTVNWSNVGNVPEYESFDVLFELRQGSTVVRSLKSTLNLRTLMPGTKQNVDNFTGLPSGTYDLYLVVKNPSGFRNIPLNQSGNKSGYLLKSGITL